MFTPSFILIPAREKIPGKEIGLLTAWFLVSQVIASVFPVLLNWAVAWCYATLSKLRRRRASGRATSTGGVDLQPQRSRKSSNATVTAVDYGLKRTSLSGGTQKLGPVATGLSAGLKAALVAPMSHIRINLNEDERRQLQGVEIEKARQQGEPVGRTPSSREHLSASGTPRSDVSTFDHPRPPRRSHHRRAQSPHPHSRSLSPRRLPTFQLPPINRPKAAVVVDADYRFPPPPSPSASEPMVSRTVSEPVPATPLSCPGEVKTTEVSPRSSLEIQVVEEQPTQPATAVNTRPSSFVPPSSNPEAALGSPVSIQGTLYGKDDGGSEGDDLEKAKQETRQGRPLSRGNFDRHLTISTDATYSGPDAVERLADWIADFITPTIYFIAFLVGIPLWFLVDSALPLFLGINLLTFIAAITIVPIKVRRFFHPILTCSVATVLIIWPFGAMKSMSLKETLQMYAVDAKYSELWSLDGYSGPVPGAGDILFSTLDAGIVALAVPMYRYRKDLAENFTRMMLVLSPCAALSLFFYPWIAHLIGMDSIRSLAFSARFMSTPLAIEMANNVGADESITVILVVVTGIVAAILKEPFFRLMRVSPDDHLCIGVSMGSVAGAIGASSLIARPRVMAIASLAFVLL
jgi:hypothetical protein